EVVAAAGPARARRRADRDVARGLALRRAREQPEHVVVPEPLARARDRADVGWRVPPRRCERAVALESRADRRDDLRRVLGGHGQEHERSLHTRNGISSHSRVDPQHLPYIAIILALAAAVALLPGGGTAAGAV